MWLCHNCRLLQASHHTSQDEQDSDMNWIHVISLYIHVRQSWNVHIILTLPEICMPVKKMWSKYWGACMGSLWHHVCSQSRMKFRAYQCSRCVTSNHDDESVSNLTKLNVSTLLTIVSTLFSAYFESIFNWSHGHQILFNIIIHWVCGSVMFTIGTVVLQCF